MTAMTTDRTPFTSSAATSIRCASEPFSDEGDLAVQEAAPKLKKPPMYTVVLMNDDYTPMDFVVDVLMMFFGHGQDKAVKIMLDVHSQGKGVCGTFTKDVAETKAAQVNEFSRSHQHPLLCEVESA